MELQAEGRIAGIEYDTQGFAKEVVSEYTLKGVQLYRYNKEENSVLIRATESSVPAFWMHITLPLDKLNDFVKLLASE